MHHWPLLLPLLLAAACTPDYPMDRPGTWSLDQAGSANDANLRAMVANPADLTAGAGEANTLGAEAARPVDRLLAGKRPDLPQSSTLQVDVGTTQPSTQGGSGAGQ